VRENKLRYICVNVIVILVTAVLFVIEYRTVSELFQNSGWMQLVILVLAVIFVHAIKATRLYLALYGADVNWRTYLKTYCKVTPVSMVFPFKLGEFFRMYCYGKHLGSGLKGIVIVLLDRFMDTIALITMILSIRIFMGGALTSFTYWLLLFLGIALLVYFVFPGVYGFWKKYLLRAKATENKLRALKMLDGLQLIYREIVNVTKGRGMILYVLSLMAWSVEIGCIVLLKQIAGEEQLGQAILTYLASAMNVEQSTELRQFVFASVILMIMLYGIIKLAELFRGKKVQE